MPCARNATSIHNVRRIIGNAMAIEQRSIFAVKALLPVMDLLVSDVITDRSIFERGDAESAIPVLPPELSAVRECVVDPL